MSSDSKEPTKAMLRKRNVAKAKALKQDRLNAVSETAADVEGSIDWESADIPLKLQQWVQVAKRDVSSRIFRDVVIRLPFKKSSKEEVLALLDPFGPVQYIQCANDANPSSSSKNGGGGNNNNNSDDMKVILEDELTDEMNASLCHLVRFDDGLDAVKAFMHLNGTAIDPQKHQDVASELYDAIHQETVRLGDEMTDEDREIAHMVAESLKPGQLIQNADVKSRLVVIGVDFFRAGVLSGTYTIPRMSLLSNAKRSPKIDFNDHHRWLQKMAVELSEIHPLVVSHDMEWSDFVFALNYTMFMHATPTATPWKSLYKACGGVEFKHRRLLQWIDRAPTETELLSGVPSSLNKRALSHSKRSLFPLSPQAKVFVAIILLILILLFWLKFTKMI